jgi:hypothetical protein
MSRYPPLDCGSNTPGRQANESVTEMVQTEMAQTEMAQTEMVQTEMVK